MTTVYGVTGTRNGGTAEQLHQLHLLTAEDAPDTVHHGDCVGVDEEFAQMMRDLYEAWVVGHPPLDPKNRAYFPSDELWPEKEYLVRDADVVEQSQRLFALPKGFKEERRSGTWATVRIARRLLKPTTIIWPDGRVRHERMSLLA